ncbi:MAG: PorV/PorQ family protein, partial [Candidatus Eisenbacteria bacterium]|nr:PorV/PorQ family protein [Candidatus Eisenbacteria bacterium]
MTSTHPARVVGRLAAALVFVAARFSLEIPRPAAADPAGFAFLKVPASARASAMGGAYASVADGVDGALWNPAALEGVKGVQILASHYEYFANLRHEQFTVAGRMFAGGISASLRALYSEPIPERDALGNLIGTFGSHDLEFGIGYGRAIAPGVRLGGSLKVVRERIADASASTWTAGAGATWERSRGHGLRLSADVHDLGPSTKFTIDGTDGSPVALPTGLRLGASDGAVIGGLDARAALETAMLSGQS